MQSCTVASFNLHWGRPARSALTYDVVAACRALDADVLALQEVWRTDGEPSLAEEVASTLGYSLYERWMCRGELDPRPSIVGRAHAAVGTADTGEALLIRVPHGTVTDHHLGGFLLDDADRYVLRSEIELEGGRLVVCASHFPHLEHISPLLRWRLRPALPPVHEPGVLMGDLNMWSWVTRFIAPGWRDAAQGATWPAPRPVFQIDHLLVTKPVVVEAAEVVRVGRSDHFPVRARVSIRS